MNRSQRRPLSRVSARVALFVSATLGLGNASAADLEETQTAVTGTESVDDLAISTAQNANATVTNVEGGKTAATATGVDALGDDDHVNGTAAVDATADATAGILAMPKPGTVDATATGISAGDGDDTVGGPLAISATSSASGAYAGFIDWSIQNPTQPKANKVEAGITTHSTATGIDTGAGDDVAGNSAALTVTAGAASGGGSAPLSVDTNKTNDIKSTSEANATATAIDAGAGSDSVDNQGVVTSAATALSGALSVSLTAPQGGATDSKPGKTQIRTEASATANATATGIDADSEESDDVDEDTRDFDTTGLRYTLDKSSTAVAGDDDVVNGVLLSNTATATAGAMGATVSNKVDGTLAATAIAEATASSNGITTGGGSDSVANLGLLSSHSTATAGALSVSIDVGAPRADGPPTPPGQTPTPQEPSPDRESKASSNTSATATANATGIDTEAGASESLTRLAEITRHSILLDEQQTTTAAAGDDVVANDGTLETVAEAAVDSLNAAVTLSTGGSANADSQSTANATGTGILTGAGDDRVTNTGAFSVSASGNALSATLALAAGKPDAAPPAGGEPAPAVSVAANTSVESNATAMGIDTEGEALSTTGSRHLSIDADGLQASRSSSQTGVAGNDAVTNTGGMSVSAEATSGAGSLAGSLGIAGSASAEASANATAASTLIYTGAGNDQVSNTRLLSSDASATAAAVSIGIAASKPAPASTGAEPAPSNVSVKAGSTATASNLGIDTEGTGHDASATDTLSITRAGLEARRARTRTSRAGADTVDNTGELRTSAEATSVTVAGGVTVGAEGTTSAEATSAADATNTAIYTGGGADTVTNGAHLQSSAEAEALSIALAVTVAQPAAGTPPAAPSEEETAKTQATANAEATASARGIDADGEGQDEDFTDTLRIDEDGLLAHRVEITRSSGADDLVTNDGAIDAGANAIAGAGAVAVGIHSDGTTAASTNAMSNATSGALLTGFGADQVQNTGRLSSTADSLSAAVSVGFTMSNEAGAKARAEANAASVARASGISTAADAGRHEREAQLLLDRDGVQLDVRDSRTADIGADDIANDGDIVANASARSVTVAAAVSINGSASTEANAAATSRADAIDAGAGPDRIFNAGALDAGATSNSVAVAASIGTSGAAKTRTEDSASASSTSTAEAFGIRADSGRDELLEGSLTVSDEGLHATLDYRTAEAASTDLVDNHGRIDATAVSTADTGSASVRMDGIANAEVKSTSTGRAVGIDTGGADDQVTNTAAVTSEADVRAVAVGLAVSANRNPGGKSRVQTDSNATASSTGIGTDGARNNQEIESELTIDASGLRLDATYSNSAAAGNDLLDNRGGVTSTAEAESDAGSLGVSIRGSASASARASAASDATALNAGAGADQVRNTGALGADATANARTISVALSKDGGATSNSGLLSAGTEANARATGIAAAGIDATETLELSENIDFDEASVTLSATHSLDALTADGVDTVTSSGDITATSEANTLEVAAGITTGGTALTIGRSSAEASATGIDSGNLGDTIDNQGAVNSSATASAIMARASVTGRGAAVAANSVWDGGTEAQATARGIDADGGERVTRELAADASASRAGVSYTRETTAASGNDTVRNRGDITTSATSEAPSFSAAVSAGTGVALAVSTATSEADAISLRGGDGNDLLDNDGDLTTTADALAVTANLSVTNTGLAGAADAVWDGGTRATANAIGIAGDGGDRTHTREISVSTDGFDHDDDGVLADGADTIENDGAVHSSATSTAASIAVAVAARGVGVATSTATSNANAAGIDAGAGSSVDNVANRGALTAEAAATAAAVSVAITNTGAALSADSVWDGGTHATSRARGIDVGTGGETITNSGAIISNSTSTTASAALSVAANGVAASVTTATGSADSTGIDASGGDDVDQVTNSAAIDVDATSFALSVAASITNNGLAIASDAIWDGGTHSSARSRGIDVGAAADTVTNSGAVTATGHATTASANLSASANGVALAASQATGLADVAALDAGAGDSRDVVANSGHLSSTADTLAVAVSASITMQGVSAASAGNAWDGGVRATANSAAANLGAGADDLADTGGMSSQAHAQSIGVAASLTMNGMAAAISNATAEARAAGVDAGAGDDRLTTAEDVSADAASEAYAVSVAITQNGVSLAGNPTWDGGTHSDSRAAALDAGTGIDVIDNRGDLASTTHAQALGAAISLNVAGVALANSTATSNADAAAIDGGDDADAIGNRGAIHVNSDADATGVNVSISGGGVALAADSVWDGGTTAVARGHGIRGGAGNDTIDNLGAAADIDSHADATTTSVSVAITGGGFAGSTSTSTARAEGAAIDAGTGNDVVNNQASVTGSAAASATSVSVSVTGGGAAVATDAFWDGGTRADAISAGLAGGDGNDTLNNAGSATASSSSSTLSATVAATFSPNFGLAAASAASTSTGNATSLEGGAGDDLVSNTGALSAVSNSTANGVSVAFTTSGVAVAGLFDASTRANASSVAIGGGDGADQLTNDQGGSILLVGNATTDHVAASLQLSGAGAANANTESVSRGVGLDGGAGNDRLRNAGTLGGTLSANANSVGVSAMAAGAGGASAHATARAEGAALAGGAGNDDLGNTGNVNLTYLANSHGQSISLALNGLQLSDAGVRSATDASGIRGDEGADAIANSANLRIDTSNTTFAQSIAGNLTGFTVASASSIADSALQGLAGGADDDVIANTTTGRIDVRGSANVNADTISVSVGGSANSDARSLATANATGISGGAGNDTAANAGTMNVQLNNTASASAASINIAGSANAVAGVEVDALAKGIDGGDGNDLLNNTGTVVVGPGAGNGVWMAELKATPMTLSIAGASDAQSATAARTQALGIDGGNGADNVVNSGTVTVNANALTTTSSGSLNIFGSASGGGESGAITQAAGIDGGADDDRLATLGALNVTATSRLVQGTTSFSFFGGGSSSNKLVALTDAAGVDGGDGADLIATDGRIVVNATSDLDSTGGGSTAFGSGGAAGEVAATTTASAVDGGAGNDIIDSVADITLSARSTLSMNNSSYTFGGSGSTGGILAALTEASGLSGSAGADVIRNGGHVTLTANSILNSTGDSNTTFGSSDDTVTSGGVSRVSGISGGADDDIIENRAEGVLDVTATTLLTVNSFASAFASNGPDSDSVLTGDAQASGLSGDSGNDQIVNNGAITVQASATLNNSGAASASFGGVGTGSSTGRSTVEAGARGLAGGDGNDRMLSNGAIEVTATGVAESVNDASTDYASVVNDNEAGAITRSTVTAIGIDGGAGTNQSEMHDDLTVNANSISYSLANASGADFSFDNNAGANAQSNAESFATGVAGQGGDDSVLLDSTALVRAHSTTAKDLTLHLTIRRDIRSDDPNANLPPPPAVDDVPAVPTFNDPQHPPAYQVGAIVFVRTPRNGDRDPNLPANATGAHYQLRNTGTASSPTYAWVFLSQGLVINDTIDIPLASFPSYAASNGSGLDGDGWAGANGSASATARGISLGAGNNSLTQTGSLTVEANAVGVMFTSSDADGFGHAQSEATGHANALAVGIDTGDGNDVITLNGNVSVLASPMVQARAHASSDTICIWFFGWWCGDIGSGESRATTTLSGESAGIRAGGGNNVISIAAGQTLSVVTRPEIRVDGTSQFITSSLATDAEINTMTSSSVARGIETGNGNDEITNRGTIAVEAWNIASDCTVTTGCYDTSRMTETIDSSGIRTFGGNDIVRNFGTIRSEVVIAGTHYSQFAVETGEGDDTLVLGDGSTVVGYVDLGNGNDTLELQGTPVIRDSQGGAVNVDAGSGTDTLVLRGPGAYNGAPSSIERAVKRDAGTYTLRTLPSMRSVAIEDGTLRLDSSYTFAAAGTYSTFFDVVNGTSGVLSMRNNTTLGGTLEVERRGDIFVANGTRWNLVHADGTMTGNFADVELPESRPLLSFALERGAHDVDVVASAPSFATVTDNPVLQRIATNLDGLTRMSAEFRTLFGRLQGMSEGFDRAFESFSPESYIATAGSALTYSRELNQALRLHLGETRTRYRLAPQLNAPDVAFSFSGGNGGISGLQIGGASAYGLNGDTGTYAAPGAQPRGRQRHSQAWMLGISARTDYDALSGYGAFQSSTQGFLAGTDRRIGDEWLVGASIGAGETDIDAGEFVQGGIDSWQASAYATWFNERWHFEGGLSVGKQQFDNQRVLEIADDMRYAGSRHDGGVWSAFAGAGARFGDDRVAIEPYVSFNYFRSREDGFVETNAAGLGQNVEASRTTALFGEGGLRFSRVQALSQSLIDWHFNLGVSHDFGLDDGKVSFSYSGAPGSWFEMQGRPDEATSRLLGAGVTLMNDMSALTLEYRGLSNDDHDEQYVGARVSLRF